MKSVTLKSTLGNSECELRRLITNSLDLGFKFLRIAIVWVAVEGGNGLDESLGSARCICLARLTKRASAGATIAM